MVFFNYATMQMAAKIVYYGPGLCGKTTNLHHIYAKTSPQSRGEMVSLETETDRTLFFDLLPIDVGVIGGFKTRLQLYTVPGQVFYNTTRKLVLKGVDGIVFVADSQKAMIEANVESLKNLRENLAEIGLDLDEIPVVLQLNKRDLPNIADIDTMLSALDPERRFEYVESIAASGTGVFETLKVISKLTLRTLRRRMTGDEPAKPATGPRAPMQFRVRDDNTGPAAAIPSRTVAQPLPGAGAFGSTAAAPSYAPAATASIASEEAQPMIAAAPPLEETRVEEAPALDSDVFRPHHDDTLTSTANVGAGAISSAIVPEPAPEPVAEAPAAASPEPDTAPQPAMPDISFNEAAQPQKAQPEVKTVKVRSSVDVMAELEALRKRATTQTTAAPKPKKDPLAELLAPKPKRDVARTVHLQLPAAVLKSKNVRLTLSFENGEGVVETRDSEIELGDTSDVQTLSVNLKIDLA